MSEFAGESSKEHDKTVAKWIMKLKKYIDDVKAGEGGNAGKQPTWQTSSGVR